MQPNTTATTYNPLQVQLAMNTLVLLLWRERLLAEPPTIETVALIAFIEEELRDA